MSSMQKKRCLKVHYTNTYSIEMLRTVSMRLDSDYSPAFAPFIYLFYFGGTSATCTVYLWDMNSACRPVNSNPHVNSNFIIIIIIFIVFSFQRNKKA